MSSSKISIYIELDTLRTQVVLQQHLEEQSMFTQMTSRLFIDSQNLFE